MRKAETKSRIRSDADTRIEFSYNEIMVMTEGETEHTSRVINISGENLCTCPENGFVAATYAPHRTATLVVLHVEADFLFSRFRIFYLVAVRRKGYFIGFSPITNCAPAAFIISLLEAL